MYRLASAALYTIILAFLKEHLSHQTINDTDYMTHLR
jgi:hypothetical protein